MEPDNIYNQLKKLLADSGGKYNILEEQINVELQVEFFELVNKLLNKKRNEEDVLNDEKKIFNSETSDHDKKIILAELSNTENPKAYRIIEKFIDTKPENLNQWAILSLQHSRISLETHFLDEQQVFISTGLGGKGDRLRYFIVCKFKEEIEIKDVQKKVLQTEFEMSFTKHNSDIEKIRYLDGYFSILGLIPINISINELIESAIHEANQYGDFIYDKFLVTNVKILNKVNIKAHFKKMGI
jgi:hypothetical protein